METSLWVEYDALLESLQGKIPKFRDQDAWTMRQTLEVLSDKQRPNEVTLAQVVEELRSLDQHFNVEHIHDCLEKLRDIRLLTVPAKVSTKIDE